MYDILYPLCLVRWQRNATCLPLSEARMRKAKAALTSLLPATLGHQHMVIPVDDTRTGDLLQGRLRTGALIPVHQGYLREDTSESKPRALCSALLGRTTRTPFLFS